MAATSQERTRKARETFNAKFSTPEEKSEYFANLARKRQGCIVLSPDEAQAIAGAYDLLRSIAERSRKTGGGNV